jgi:hypothetical protein
LVLQLPVASQLDPHVAAPPQNRLQLFSQDVIWQVLAPVQVRLQLPPGQSSVQDSESEHSTLQLPPGQDIAQDVLSAPHFNAHPA